MWFRGCTIVHLLKGYRKLVAIAERWLVGVVGMRLFRPLQQLVNDGDDAGAAEFLRRLLLQRRFATLLLLLLQLKLRLLLSFVFLAFQR